jgi:hypothetical protein
MAKKFDGVTRTTKIEKRQDLAASRSEIFPEFFRPDFSEIFSTLDFRRGSSEASPFQKKMGAMTAKPKSSSGAILRRRRAAVAAFRRDRRTDDETRASPDWGRIVLRSGSTTLR